MFIYFFLIKYSEYIKLLAIMVESATIEMHFETNSNMEGAGGEESDMHNLTAKLMLKCLNREGKF